jgi:hypothetical protein
MVLHYLQLSPKANPTVPVWGISQWGIIRQKMHQSDRSEDSTPEHCPFICTYEILLRSHADFLLRRLIIERRGQLCLKASERRRLSILDIQIVVLEALHVNFAVFCIAIVALLAEQRSDWSVARSGSSALK